MKRSILPLTLLLPVLAAATAAAQIATFRLSAPVNPVASLPKMLPGPLVGPLAGAGITLPSLVPASMPSILFPVLAPSFIAPAKRPAGAPSSREDRLPVAPAKPSHDGVVNPLQRVMPGVVIRFDGPMAPAKSGAAKPDASKEKLDQEFDGEGAPPKPVVGLPYRAPVSSGRRITLPEWDLERELGI